jgi:hypothetical protein
MSELEHRGKGAAQANEDVERAKARLSEERRAADHLAEDARSAAGGMAERAKATAVNQSEEARDAAAGHLRTFAEAIRHAGDELAEKEPGPVGDLVRQAARGLEQFSDGLGRRSPAEMIDSVRDFGRRNPVAFLAGSMLAGFALARFATSSSDGGRYGASYGGSYGSRFSEDQGRFEDPASSGSRPSYASGGAGGTVGGAGVYQTGTSAAPGGAGVRGGTTVGSGPAIPSGGGTSGSGALGGSAAGLSGQTQTESDRWSTNRPDPDMKRDI